MPSSREAARRGRSYPRLDPNSGEEVAKIVSEIINAPPAVIAKARGALRGKGLVECKQFTDANYCAQPKKKKKEG